MIMKFLIFYNELNFLESFFTSNNKGDEPQLIKLANNINMMPTYVMPGLILNFSIIFY
jgi:hypothetical protein